MSPLNIILIFITISLIVWSLYKPLEAFAGSDWGFSFWGPSLWSGWTYGSAPKPSAPRPEDTSHL